MLTSDEAVPCSTSDTHLEWYQRGRMIAKMSCNSSQHLNEFHEHSYVVIIIITLYREVGYPTQQGDGVPKTTGRMEPNTTRRWDTQTQQGDGVHKKTGNMEPNTTRR